MKDPDRLRNGDLRVYIGQMDKPYSIELMEIIEKEMIYRKVDVMILTNFSVPDEMVALQHCTLSAEGVSIFINVNTLTVDG